MSDHDQPVAGESAGSAVHSRRAESALGRRHHRVRHRREREALQEQRGQLSNFGSRGPPSPDGVDVRVSVLHHLLPVDVGEAICQKKRSFQMTGVVELKPPRICLERAQLRVPQHTL